LAIFIVDGNYLEKEKRMAHHNRKKSLDEVAPGNNYQNAEAILNDKTKLLDTVMSSMGDGLSIQDLDMRIVYQNKVMIENFGAHIGEHCYNIYERRDKICEGCPVAQAYKTGKVAKAMRVGITKDGASYRFENIASVLKNEQGEVVAGMELCRFVEDKEKAFDDLRKKTKELEKFNKLLVDREIRMIELKKHIDALLIELGREPKYRA
jgi:PAS domain-containing protein